MDGLIVLLIIIGIVSRISKNKKKKAGGNAASRQNHVEIPFSTEDWTALIAKNMPETAVSAPSSEGRSARRPLPGLSAEGHLHGHQAMPEGVSPALVSTQGESEKEHRAHVEKIAAAEKQRSERMQAHEEARAMNREKLRRAVIMSEILNKPVALRGRR